MVDRNHLGYEDNRFIRFPHSSEGQNWECVNPYHGFSDKADADKLAKKIRSFGFQCRINIWKDSRGDDGTFYLYTPQLYPPNGLAYEMYDEYVAYKLMPPDLAHTIEKLLDKARIPNSGFSEPMKKKIEDICWKAVYNTTQAHLVPWDHYRNAIGELLMGDSGSSRKVRKNINKSSGRRL